jgi:selenocysteine lyase/cysteine desulfurase
MRRRQFLSGLGTAAGAWLLGGRSAGVSGLSDLQRLAQTAPGSADLWRLMRAQFRLPADFAYFNTAGLGASPFVVTERVKAMMDRKEEAPAPGHNEDDWRRIRGKCATLVGPACRADEIALVSTATEGINIILNGLPLRRGDEVITSTHEHPAVVVPLLHKMKTVGIDVKTFEPDLRTAAGNLERIRALLTPRTRLIFVSHVTCTTGQILPVADIGRLAADRKLWFALDGAQSLAQFPWNVKASGAHFYTASGHKWLLGPKRTGILWVHPDHIAGLTPSIVGAYSDTSNSLALRELTLHANAQRFEYGTQNDALIYGLETAADLVGSLGLANIWAHNQALTLQCLAGLQGVAGLDVLSPPEPAARSAMVTFRLAGRDNRQVANALTGRRLRVRSVTEGGLDAVRASFHVCNGEDQVERLVAAIKDLAGSRS